MLESVYERNVNNDNCSFKTVGYGACFSFGTYDKQLWYVHILS